MKLSFLTMPNHVTLFVRDEKGVLLMSHTEEALPTSSLLYVPPPFNPFPSTWQGPSEPPLERM